MSGLNPDLALLKAMLKDDSRHIAIGIIKSIDLAADRSFLKCLVKIFPENIEYVARMTWDSIGSGSGSMTFPNPNDMVLVAFADGDEDSCYIIKRLSTKEDQIPIQAVTGDSVLISKDGKRSWLISNEKIFLAKGENEPTEPLVLGNVLKTLLSDILDKLADLADKLSQHKHLGNLGYPTSAPDLSAAFTAMYSFFLELKASPVDDSAMLSDISFTEKGD